MKSKSVFYVYGLIDPRTQSPFYIGKGCGRRASRHIRNAAAGRTSENPFKDAVMAKILADGLMPTVQYFGEGLEESAAYDLEESLIRKFGRRGKEEGGCLTNINLEGRVPKNTGRTWFSKGFTPWNKGKTGCFRHSDETRAKMSVSKMGHPDYRAGQKRTPEEIAKRVAKLKGRVVSNVTRERLRQSNLGKHYGDEVSRDAARHRALNMSQETKSKIITILKNKPPVSEETRLKQSASAKKAWSRRKGMDT